VHAENPLHRLGVVVVAGERAHAGRRPGRRGIGLPGHERGDGGGPGPTLVGVVGKTLGHEQRPEVGVAEAELTVTTRVLGDLLRRVVGVADQDLLSGEDDLDRGLETVGVEAAVVVQILEQVEDARLHAELSRCMYSLQFRTTMPSTT
jgi:hypothetical protein